MPYSSSDLAVAQAGKAQLQHPSAELEILHASHGGDAAVARFIVARDRVQHDALGSVSQQGALIEGVPSNSSNYPQLRDPDWLRQQYVDLDKSIKDIASEVGAKPSTVRYNLPRNGVPLRQSGPTDTTPTASSRTRTGSGTSTST
jgi:hypothetical protein